MQADAKISAMENITTNARAGMDWLVTFKDPKTLWADNWFSVVLELGVLGLFIQACYHAYRRGEKAMFLIVTLLISSVFIELLQQIPHSGYELWWYHETIVNMFHHKVPLYVLCLFSVVYYFLDYASRDVNLPVLTKALATACGAMFVTYPLLMLAPHYLLMMVHFDDPVFQDRLVNVPYSELSYLFLLFFHIGHIYNTLFSEIEVQDRQFFRYFRCAFQSGLVSAAYSLVEFYLLYVVFKLILHLSSGLCVLGSLVILGFMAKDEVLEKVESFATYGISTVVKRKEWKYLVAFFLLVSFLPLMVHPESLKSTGVRLELGPCGETHWISNMSPLDVSRRRYICPNDTERIGFDFHCVPKMNHLSSEIKKHYTICGRPFSNPTRLCQYLLWYSAVCMGCFYLLFAMRITLYSTPTSEKTKKIE